MQLNLLKFYNMWTMFLLVGSIVVRINTFGAITPSWGEEQKNSRNISKFLEGYDKRLRPKFGHDPLKVTIDLIISSFDSISEVNMDYTITMVLIHYWRDERLAFDNDKPESQMTLAADFADQIWVPDTFFANDKDSYLHDVTEKNKMIRLFGNGSIVYGMRFTTTLSCNMDLHYYPLDEQQCTIELESYGYTTTELKMDWTDGRNSIYQVENMKLPQFTLIDYNAILVSQNLTTGEYDRLSLRFVLRRDIGYFLFQTYLPSILIVMLSWVSFWINHEATSARVALGITTVLTMTTISTGVRGSLPRISYVKAIDIYLVTCFAFVFTALLEYAAVNYSYWGERAKQKSRSVRRRSSMSHSLHASNSVNAKTTSFPQIIETKKKNHNHNGCIAMKEIQNSILTNRIGGTSTTLGPRKFTRFGFNFVDKGMVFANNQQDMSPIISLRDRFKWNQKINSKSDAENGLSYVQKENKNALRDEDAPTGSSDEVTAAESSSDSSIESGFDNLPDETLVKDNDLYRSIARFKDINSKSMVVDSCEEEKTSNMWEPISVSQEDKLLVETFRNSALFRENFNRLSNEIFPKIQEQGLRRRVSRVQDSFQNEKPSNELHASAHYQRQKKRRFKPRIPIPKIRDVNKIDRYSRMFFPSLFVVFNILYWGFYLVRRFSTTAVH